jgi:hypothetical protein
VAPTTQSREALRARILAGTCVAIGEGGPRPSLITILRRSRVRKEGFYEVFDGLDDCVKDSLRHSLDRLFARIDAGGDWPSWVASNRPEATVIAWGFAIDPQAIEAAIDRAAEQLPLDRMTAIGVIGGIYCTVGARLRAGRALHPATVRVLRDFAAEYGA